MSAASPSTAPAYGAKRLMWIDLETTGLDPKTDQILEVACVITDENLVEIAQCEWVVRPERAVCVDSVVLAMHTKNGLFAAIADNRGCNLDDVAVSLADFIDHHEIRGKALIAGSTPQFDKSFLAVHMPAVFEFFNHRVFDVSTLKAAARMWGGWPEKDLMPAAHRAMSDILYSIEEAKEIRARYFAAPRAMETYTAAEVFGPDLHTLPDRLRALGGEG